MSEIERILNLKEKKIKKNLLSRLNLLIKKFLNDMFKNYYEFKKFKKKKKTFNGWGLTTTDTIPPWENKVIKENIFFNKINLNLINLVEKKEFKLTQFDYKNTDYKKILDELAWRHYIIFNSVILASKKTSLSNMKLVECGVCDGLTIYFAIKACEISNKEKKAYLYDTWETLEGDKLRFRYDYLDIDITKKNLDCFQENLIFNKGLIPNIFKNATNPSEVSWLHIDLNSADATKSSLDFFYDKLISGGIILFDDYGGFEDTRKVIDNFFDNKNGHFINYPTGQGVFIKI
tara:strand:- start:190 stop:1059 length:870 start_codon:yes stop_codon:yes gene_type:complete